MGTATSERTAARIGSPRTETYRPPIVQHPFTLAVAPQRHTDAVASKELQGWHPDPFGLHEMRYFSVGRPTKLVRDGRVEAYEEPPDEWSAVGAATGAQAVAADSAQAAGSRTEMPAVAFSGTATPVAAVAGPPMFAAAAPAAQSPVARPRGRRMEYAFVAAGAVVAVLVFVALGGGSGKPGIAPAAFVTKAAQQTLAEHTADFTLSATVHASGQTMAMGGSGQIDIANGAMSFNVGASTAGGSVTENAIDVGGISYLKVTVNGHSLPLSGGRHWIETPFAPTAGRSFATTSPDSTLALLSQQGARVTPLGSRSIGGQNCNGYTVTPSSRAMLAGARQEFAKNGMSAAETNAALEALRNAQPPTITAWFGAQTKLACQVTFSVQFGNPTSSGSGGVQSQLTFTHYGVPVNITAPPSSDTVSLQQYLQALHL
jgi:hypothetical protein